LYTSSNQKTNSINIYPKIYYADINNTRTLLADGSNNAVNAVNTTTINTKQITSVNTYINTVLLPNTNYSIQIDIYIVSTTAKSNDTLSLYFRSTDGSSLSHVHTTLYTYSNIVDLTSQQTITGTKTFTSPLIVGNNFIDSTSVTSGALRVGGGAGIQGNIYMGGTWS
jgi:hypothetical protein